jgi:hypothetical protein
MAANVLKEAESKGNTNLTHCFMCANVHKAMFPE